MVKEALGTKARIHSGKKLPEGEAPSSVLLCPNGEGITSGMKRVRALASDAPVVLFGQRVEPQLAEKALRAGASGFVHAGMPPEMISRGLLLAPRRRGCDSPGALGGVGGAAAFPEAAEPSRALAARSPE